MADLTDDQRDFMTRCPIEVMHGTPDGDIAEALVPTGFLQTVSAIGSKTTYDLSLVGRRSLPTHFNLHLTAVGENPIAMMKIMRDATGKELSELKMAFDQVPALMKENVPLAEAQLIKKTVADAGGTVSLAPCA